MSKWETADFGAEGKEWRGLRIVECLRCGHEWPTKGEPRVCPRCKSAWWDQPKKGEK